jgi:hypothetical protein
MGEIHTSSALADRMVCLVQGAENLAADWEKAQSTLIDGISIVANSLDRYRPADNIACSRRPRHRAE